MDSKHAFLGHGGCPKTTLWPTAVVKQIDLPAELHYFRGSQTLKMTPYPVAPFPCKDVDPEFLGFITTPEKNGPLFFRFAHDNAGPGLCDGSPPFAAQYPVSGGMRTQHWYRYQNGQWSRVTGSLATVSSGIGQIFHMPDGVWTASRDGIVHLLDNQGNAVEYRHDHGGSHFAVEFL